MTHDEALRQARDYHRARQYHLAEGLYRHLLRTEPEYAGAHEGLGRLALETKRPELAVEHLARAVSLDRGNSLSAALLGMAHAAAGQLGEAERHLRRALEISPDLPEAHINLAGTLERQGRFAEALPFAQRGVQLAPHHPRVHCNLGNILYHLGRVEESIATQRRAVALDPSFAKAHWSLSQSLLVAGRFETGWDEYEWRTVEHRLPRGLSPAPAWDGSSLANQSIFLHGEQGIGDEIMFASCLPDVLQQAARVTIACRDRLVPLFARSFPQAKVCALSASGTGMSLDIPASDWQSPLGSLPRWYRRSWESFPRERTYLVADPQKIAAWREKFSALGRGLKIGIAWRAGGLAKEQLRRTTELRDWRPLLTIPGVQFVNLQYGDCREELTRVSQEFGVMLHDWPECDPLRDLDESAAQIAALDLVIAVGNTTVHLAGALGVPTWAIVPRVPGWRWLLEGGELPWYSCVELFRQSRDGQWQDVFADVAVRLQQRLAPENTRSAGSDSKAEALPFDAIHARHCAGDLATAEAGYREILRREPGHADALHHLGVLCCQTGRHEESLSWLDRALAIDDSDALVHFHRASALEELGRKREAIAALQMAVAMKPTFAEAYVRLTGLLEAEGRFGDALPMSTRAVKYAPRDVRARYGHGTVLFHLGKATEAIEHLDLAAELDPKFPYAPWNGAMARLQLGRFDEGWQRYEWREAAGVAHLDRCDAPRWSGESLRGKRLAVLAEQGVGDEVMFASLYPDLLSQAERCTFTCSPRLEQLLRRSFPQATICAFARGAGRTFVPPERVDFHLHAGSAPQYLRRDLASFPRRASYLVPDAKQVDAWRRRFAELGPGLKVGISWRAGGLGKEQRRRTAPLEQWQSLLRVEGAQFINLQYGECQRELDEARTKYGLTIHHFAEVDPLGDLDPVAAQIAALDYVLSVGNTTVHLAGALGVPTLVVLPQVPGWRWLLEGDQMPWYGEVELLRQSKADEWGPVFRNAESRLRSRIRARHESAPPSSSSKSAKPASRKELARVESLLLEAGRYHDARDFAPAEDRYRRLLARVPNHTTARHRLAILLLQTERSAEALEHLTEVLKLEPNHYLYHHHAATALVNLERLDEAVAHLEKSIAAQPGFAESQLNLGGLLERLGRIADALPVCQLAYELAPKCAKAAYNLANVLFHLGRAEEALPIYRQACELEPEYAKAQWNTAMTLLQLGHFAEGWQKYEWREKAGEVVLDRCPRPLWDGSSLTGKNILILAEQGIGDEVMFSSCFPDVVAQAKHCVIGCQPRLAKLFARSFPQATVHGFLRSDGNQWVPPVPIDCYTPMGSLPLRYRPTWESFPKRTHYLVPDAEKVRQWRERFASLGTGPKIGISWRAGGVAKEQLRRATQFELWRPLIETPGAHFINLQYGDCQLELEQAERQWNVKIHEWPEADPLGELDSVAAQIAALDLVVAVGNTSVHMAGALGVPAWAILPRVPGWRWMLHTDTIPWYTSVELFRQSEADGWTGLFQRISARLNGFIAEHTARTATKNRPAGGALPAATAANETTPPPAKTGKKSPASNPGEADRQFARAVALRDSGRFREATHALERVLELRPHDAAACQQLGGIYRAEGRNNDALAWLSRAVQYETDLAAAWIELAQLQLQLGRWPDAVTSLDRALELQPGDANLLNCLGAALQQCGRADEAIRKLVEATELAPRSAECWNNLGCAQQALDRDEEAIESFRHASDLAPRLAEPYFGCGTSLRKLGRLDEALCAYRTVAEIHPELATAQLDLASMLQELGDHEQSLAHYRRAAELNPRLWGAQMGLGNALDELDCPLEALAAFDAAIALDHRQPELHYNRANLLRKLEQFDDAVKAYRQALALRPNYAKAHTNLAKTLRSLARPAEAVEHYRAALAAGFDPASGQMNLAMALLEAGDIAGAAAAYDQALVHQPGYTPALVSRAMIHLLEGRLSEGWRQYEQRWQNQPVTQQPKARLDRPMWDGASLAGKSIFVQAEQGVGDEIMFASCLPDLIAHARHCVVECDPRLVPLYARSFPTATICGTKGAEELNTVLRDQPIDVQVLAGSLPRFLRPELASFPERVSYLTVDPAETDQWRARFASLGRTWKIGIAWSGGADVDERRLRSTPFDAWKELFELPGVSYINLQYGEQRRAIRGQKLSIAIHDWDDVDPLIDLDGQAAQISALDLVISVTNAGVHLSGALGVPTLVLLPYVPSWRWMLRRADSPWYPSVRLLRQESPGDWTAPFAKALEHVRTFLASGEPECGPVQYRVDRAAPRPHAPQLGDTRQPMKRGGR
ncbi:MAG: tetratricopeptide repeat protein [Pirellulales bacterium]|nr:tetratricopeptide repeat protein [Pirellulales bacterium]